MKCPGCGVNLMNSSIKECPRCHYLLGSADGGTKYLIWLNQHEAELEEKRKQDAEKTQEKIDSEFRAASSRTELNAKYLDVALNHLRQTGADGYYEYSVKTLVDEGGRTNTLKMAEMLNQMGLAGWRLVSSHTNELGKNALIISGFGINSTADETVLIFERFVRI